MMRRRYAWVAMLALLVCGLPATSPAVTVSAGFIASNPQIFPVGDLVSIDDIQSGNDIDLGTLPRMFTISIQPTTEDDTTHIVLQVSLQGGGTTLLNYVSSPFTIAYWRDHSPSGNGVYDNRQLDGLELGENATESFYATTEEFLQLLDGSNLSAGTYQLTVTVYDVDAFGNMGTPIGTYTNITQVYNPVPPALQSPSDGEEVAGYPIHFTWNWYGADVMRDDVTLIVVEGQPGEDGETVIASRNSSNTRYEGPPSLIDSHTYTGFAGTEQGLTPGETYYWMVKVRVNTVVPGSSRELESNVFSFTFAEDAGGDLSGGGLGGGGTTSGSGGGTDQGGNDPVLDQLAAVLPADMMQSLYNSFQGFSAQSIVIDGVSGYNLQDLMRLLNEPDVTIVTVGVE